MIKEICSEVWGWDSPNGSKIEGKEIKSDVDQINFSCFSLIQVLLQSHFKILVCLYIYCLINFALINLI